MLPSVFRHRNWALFILIFLVIGAAALFGTTAGTSNPDIFAEEGLTILMIIGAVFGYAVLILIGVVFQNGLWLLIFITTCRFRIWGDSFSNRKLNSQNTWVSLLAMCSLASFL